MEYMWLLIVFLILMALILLVAEMFVVGGILGTMGVLMLTAATVLSFREYGTGTGILVMILSIGASIAVAVIGFKVIPNTKLGKQLFLQESVSQKDGFSSMDTTLNQYLGKNGITVSLLHPAGLAEINGERLTVSTEGECVESGIPIEVVGIRYNQLLVRARS